MIQMSDRRVRACVLLLAVASVLAGCSGGGVHFGGAQSDTVPVTMSMTDTPPAGVSVLSFQVTITDARLNPGNVELLAAPVTVDLARLQTETSLLSVGQRRARDIHQPRPDHCGQSLAHLPKQQRSGAYRRRSPVRQRRDLHDGTHDGE